MDQKNFKTWLENIDKQISTEKIDLDNLNLAYDPSDIQELFPDVLEKKIPQNKKPLPTFGSLNSTSKISSRKSSIQEVVGSFQLSRTSSTSEKKIPQKQMKGLYNKELVFKPQINKKSQKIAQGLGSSAQRLMMSKSAKNTDAFSFLSQTPSCDSLTSLQSEFGRLENSLMKSHKTKIHKNVNIQISVQKMLDWNRLRLQKINQNREKRLKEDLEECSFKPNIKAKDPQIKNSTQTLEKQDLTAGIVKGAYSIKGSMPLIIENTKEPEPQVKDITDEEYNHAVKRLHWELEAIFT
ncbi:hypothetical protein SteCoe_24458 [Stentor coeruleus]|uniref:Uncharacterized protein n=1 Tax=Stentor coeruleus TaxID=5963 RepID=A0A1R2BHF7_9CILI|nr:hypothetical protein SteCoe_24458 [Stentor coeruleus]